MSRHRTAATARRIPGADERAAALHLPFERSEAIREEPPSTCAASAISNSKDSTNPRRASPRCGNWGSPPPSRGGSEWPNAHHSGECS